METHAMQAIVDFQNLNPSHKLGFKKFQMENIFCFGASTVFNALRAWIIAGSKVYLDNSS